MNVILNDEAKKMHEALVKSRAVHQDIVDKSDPDDIEHIQAREAIETIDSVIGKAR